MVLGSSLVLGAIHAVSVGMAGVNRFEDLRVWQAAKRQCDRVGELIKRPEFLQDLDLATQVNAASVSTMNNICEGFVRHRDKELMQLLRYSAD